jgi:hypothetical protein
MADGTRSDGLERLEAFTGNWRVEASFPIAPLAAAGSGAGAASAVFEWALDAQFMVQRATAPPPAPNSLAIISVDSDGERYTQHYFDSRGVVRIYAMTLSDGVWTLLRENPDFSPLDFSQRFTGTFSDDGNAIVGHWEMSWGGGHWEHDFDLTYSKVT